MNDHFNLAKWRTLSFNEQMGNIGSEVGRSMNAIRSGDDTSLTGAFYRGLDLIDATASSPNLPPARRRELLRTREEFCRAVESKRADQKLDEYFMTFALLARSAKH